MFVVFRAKVPSRGSVSPSLAFVSAAADDFRNVGWLDGGVQQGAGLSAAKLVNKWWGVIEVVAKTLLERETLTGDEIWKVLDEAERQEKLEMRRRKRRLKTLRAR
jgi:hypothetical protein